MTVESLTTDSDRNQDNGRDVPYDVASVAESFLERVSDAVNVEPEAEEAIRAATFGAPDPETALDQALAACLTALGSPDEAESDASLRREEERAARLAADELRAAWERQGDVPPTSPPEDA